MKEVIFGQFIDIKFIEDFSTNDCSFQKDETYTVRFIGKINATNGLKYRVATLEGKFISIDAKAIDLNNVRRVGYHGW